MLYKLALLSGVVISALFSQVCDAQTVYLSSADIQGLNSSAKKAEPRLDASGRQEADVVQKLASSAGEGYQLQLISSKPRLKSSIKPVINPLIKASQKPSLTHSRYQLFYQQIPVWGHEVLLHSDSRGEVKKLNGTMVMHLDLQLGQQQSLIAKITRPQALAYAQTRLAKTHDVSPEVFIVDEKRVEQRNLVIFIDQNDVPRLAYHIRLSYTDVLGMVRSYALMIDAQQLSVISQWDTVKHFDATGPGGNEAIGQYEYGTDKPHLSVTVSGDTCSMVNDYVQTADLQNSSSGHGIFSFDCARNTHKAVNGAFAPINDLHFNATQSLKMYEQWYGMALPGVLKVNAHTGNSLADAYMRDGQLFFGDGDEQHYPYTTIDVVGHEVGHYFTSKHSKLSNAAANVQTLALSESFADIAGEATELFINGQNDWIVGGQVKKQSGGERQFADPTLDGHSIGHIDDFDFSQDAYEAAGVFNKAFYQLAHKDGWNVRRAFGVFAAANRDYWYRFSTFNGASCGVLEAADDAHATLYPVAEAFASVGIYCIAPPFVDNDQDGMNDLWEIQHGFDYNNAADARTDRDNDGLNNLQEYLNDGNPSLSDSDFDGLSDSEEVALGTLVNDPDTDGDHLPDGWEVSFDLNPLHKVDFEHDSDGDGIPDYAEYKTGFDPTNPQSKPVALSAFVESFEGQTLPQNWHSPVDAQPWQLSTDNARMGQQSLLAKRDKQQQRVIEISGYFAAGVMKLDYLFDLLPQDAGFIIQQVIDPYISVSSTIYGSTEGQWETHQFIIQEGYHTVRLRFTANDDDATLFVDKLRFFAENADSDSDGMSDHFEVDYGLDYQDPADAGQDLDGDGLTNLEEFDLNIKPNMADTDQDGLDDGDEVNVYGTRADRADTDADSIPDGIEIELGLDPLTANGIDADADGDGVNDRAEYFAGTDPQDPADKPIRYDLIQFDFEHSDTLPTPLY